MVAARKRATVRRVASLDARLHAGRHERPDVGMAPAQARRIREVVQADASVPDRVLARVERVAEVRERGVALARARGAIARRSSSGPKTSEAVGLKCRSGRCRPGHFMSTSTLARPAASASSGSVLPRQPTAR